MIDLLRFRRSANLEGDGIQPVCEQKISKRSWPHELKPNSCLAACGMTQSGPRHKTPAGKILPAAYDEKDEPQPQERVELGLMKLNPWRISVSS
jgi:hypothetical protein